MGTEETEGGSGEGFGGARGEEKDMDVILALCGRRIESVIGFRDESRYWELHWHDGLFTTLCTYTLRYYYTRWINASHAVSRGYHAMQNQTEQVHIFAILRNQPSQETFASPGSSSSSVLASIWRTFRSKSATSFSTSSTLDSKALNS